MKQFDSPMAKGSDFEVAALEGLADDLEDSDVDGMEDGNGQDNDSVDEEIVNGRKGMEEGKIQALED